MFDQIAKSKKQKARKSVILNLDSVFHSKQTFDPETILNRVQDRIQGDRSEFFTRRSSLCAQFDLSVFFIRPRIDAADILRRQEARLA